MMMDNCRLILEFPVAAIAVTLFEQYATAVTNKSVNRRKGLTAKTEIITGKLAAVIEITVRE